MIAAEIYADESDANYSLEIWCDSMAPARYHFHLTIKKRHRKTKRYELKDATLNLWDKWQTIVRVTEYNSV